MTSSVVSLAPIPTGGAVRLDLYRDAQGVPVVPSGVTQMTIGRAVSGAAGLGAFTQIYSGVPLATWIDVGDALPGPLASGCSYVWAVTDDVNGTVQTAAVQPASNMEFTPDALTQLLLRLLQCGVDNLDLPEGINRVYVSTQMPQAGLAALPFMIVNLELIEQSETGIGTDVQDPDRTNTWTVWVNAMRTWRVSLFCRNPAERDYYRDCVLAMMQVWHASVFTPIGQNVTHRFMAHSGTDASEGMIHTPGFYDADIMLVIDGVFDVAVLSAYGVIERFQVEVSATSGAGAVVVDEVLVPPTS